MDEYFRCGGMNLGSRGREVDNHQDRGWREDPWATSEHPKSLRWWDGSGWTDSVRTWTGTVWVDSVQAPRPEEDVQLKAEFPTDLDGNPERILVEDSFGLRCPTCESPVMDGGWRVCPHCGEVLAQGHCQPGDIVNGHVLGSDHVWHPIGDATLAQGREDPSAYGPTNQPLTNLKNGKPNNSPALWAAGGLISLLVALLVVVLVANTRSATQESTVSSSPAASPSEEVVPSTHPLTGTLVTSIAVEGVTHTCVEFEGSQLCYEGEDLPGDPDAPPDALCEKKTCTPLSAESLTEAAVRVWVTEHVDAVNMGALCYASVMSVDQAVSTWADFQWAAPEFGEAFPQVSAQDFYSYIQPLCGYR